MGWKQNEQNKRSADMEALGIALQRIREIVRKDRIASYTPQGPSFQRIFADAMLQSYLRDGEIAQSAKPKPKTKRAAA